MHQHTRSVSWDGQTFHFESLQPSPSENHHWAVSRQGEFIGTMPCEVEVPTKEFEVRCLRWLGELLGGLSAEVSGD
jgi:hypothetical protein